VALTPLARPAPRYSGDDSPVQVAPHAVTVEAANHGRRRQLARLSVFRRPAMLNPSLTYVTDPPGPLQQVTGRVGVDTQNDILGIAL